MFSKLLEKLIYLFDSGELIKTSLSHLMKGIGVFLIIHGIIGGIYFFANIIDNDYIGGLNQFTAFILMILHMVIFTIVGRLYLIRSQSFIKLTHRGIIHQWVSISRRSLEAVSLLIFGFFLTAGVATLISGPDGIRVNYYMLNTSFDWVFDLLRKLFNHDSEILSRLFSFLMVIFGAFVAWSTYYFSSFIFELIETGDRFFKRVPEKKYRESNQND